MNKQEFDAVMKLPSVRRYEHFVKVVADWEVIWGLYNDGWASGEDDEGNTLLPLWPKKEYAEFFAKDDWSAFTPKEIDLNEFMTEWLPDMERDKIQPSIFWNGTDSIVPTIDRLLHDLSGELDKY